MNITIIYIVAVVTIFIDLIRYLVIFDIILSWLSLAGLKWRPKFLSDIIDPMYKWIRSFIPTNFGPFDFTPIIVILGLGIVNVLIFGLFPEATQAIQLLFKAN